MLCHITADFKRVKSKLDICIQAPFHWRTCVALNFTASHMTKKCLYRFHSEITTTHGFVLLITRRRLLWNPKIKMFSCVRRCPFAGNSSHRCFYQILGMFSVHYLILWGTSSRGFKMNLNHSSEFVCVTLSSLRCAAHFCIDFITSEYPSLYFWYFLTGPLHTAWCFHALHCAEILPRDEWASVNWCGSSISCFIQREVFFFQNKWTPLL